MEPLSIALVISAILITILYFIKRRYTHWKEIGAPFIEPTFPYGNLNSSKLKQHPCLIFKNYYDKFKGKGPFVGLYFFFIPVALILDPNLAKSILIKDFSNFHDRGHYFNEKDDPISAHLFTIYGEKWRIMRAKLTPTFSSGKMKNMFSIVLEVGYRLQKKLSKLCSETNEFDIKYTMGQFTSDVIGTTAFGIDFNSLEGENKEFLEMSALVFEKPRHTFTTEMFLLAIRNWAQKLGIKATRDDTTAFYTKIVSDTIKYRDENNINRNDFLNILMQLRTSNKNDHGLTFSEILAQAYVFLIAGYETSSTLQTFALYELAYNQDIQEKTRQHIMEIIKKYDGKFTYEALIDMKYLDQVLNETLRKYPPVPTLTRIVDTDYTVPGTDYIFKKGTIILLPIYAIQRDPIHYKNPDLFDPENFSPENILNRHPQAFLPFGDGPRNCMGLRFGMMQAKIGMVLTLLKFAFSPGRATKYPIDMAPETFTCSPVGGMPLRVEEYLQ